MTARIECAASPQSLNMDGRKTGKVLFFFFCFVTLYINCLFSFVADLVHNYPYKSLLTWLGSKKEKREKRKAATMYTNNRIIQVMS